MKLWHIIIECDDVASQTRFWQAALSPDVAAAESPELTFVDKGEATGGVGRSSVDGYGKRPGGTGLRFVPDASGVEPEVTRLVELGATVVRKYHNGWGFGEVVMADPEGNEFLLESHDDDHVIEARLEQGEREDGGPFWADAVPPEPRSGTVIGVAFAAEESDRD